MFDKNFDMKKWKEAELKHYKDLLNTLDRNSKEYQLLKSGIDSLERSPA
jgi:hypothetical protein